LYVRKRQDNIINYHGRGGCLEGYLGNMYRMKDMRNHLIFY